MNKGSSKIPQIIIANKTYYSSEYLAKKFKCSESHIRSKALKYEIEFIEASGLKYYLNDFRFEKREPKTFATEEGRQNINRVPNYVTLAGELKVMQEKIDKLIQQQRELIDCLRGTTRPYNEKLLNGLDTQITGQEHP